MLGSVPPISSIQPEDVTFSTLLRCCSACPTPFPSANPRIPFFEKYRRWKSFTMWKRVVKAHKFTQASSALSQGLFTFVTPLRFAMSEIRKQCVDVEKRQLLAVGGGETITLPAFMDRQRVTQQAMAQVERCLSADDNWPRTPPVFSCRSGTLYMAVAFELHPQVLSSR